MCGHAQSTDSHQGVSDAAETACFQGEVTTSQVGKRPSCIHKKVTCQLRSSTSQQLSCPRTRVNLGKHVFSVAVRSIMNFQQHYRHVKVYLHSANISRPIFQNCISTLNPRWSHFLMTTLACACCLQ